MKRLVKICLILCAVLTILGLGGIGVGIAMGVRPGQLLNMAHVSPSFGPWHGLRGLFWDLDEEWNGWQHDRGECREEDHLQRTSWSEDSFEREFGNAGTDSLILDLYNSNVTIQRHQADDIFIKGKNAENYFQAYEDGTVLTLEDHRKSVITPLELEIYLPDRMFKSIYIDAGISDINAEELLAEEISLEVGAGRFKADKVTAEQTADIRVGTGDMTVESLAGRELFLDCGVGTLTAAAEGKETDYNYSLSCGIGSITLNGEKHAGGSYNMETDNQAEKDVMISCGIGTVSLDFMEE